MSSWLPIHRRDCYPRTIRHRLCQVNRTALWLSLAATFLLSLHSLLRQLRPEYAHFTSVSNVRAHLQWVGNITYPYGHGTDGDADSDYELGSNGTGRAKAVLLMLARNSELAGAISSVQQLEDRFNKKFGYPWVFLNEVPFTDEFKQNMSAIISGPVSFGVIPHDHWYQPDWIDEDKAAEGRAELVANNVIYGDSVSYRNMCRFNSGFFYRHPLVRKYKWYWRVEPNVNFLCDTDYDPFLFMEENDKVYGFTISLYEWPQTVKTLWSATKEFIDNNPDLLAPNNSMKFLSENGGHTYNMCHFWSNFEIANMEFWRGEAYSKYFEHLESKGGFYYERWGDAPVHSIGASLFARKDQIHFFHDIGYQHPPFTHCPSDMNVRKEKNCTCNGMGNFDFNGYSCLRKWEQVLWS